MNKKFRTYLIIWAIIFAVFNVICFVVLDEMMGMSKFGGAFWSGFVFIDLAFIGQLICAFFALKADTLEKQFLNMSMLTVCYTGLIVTIIIGAACMVIPGLPNWIGIIVCLIAIAFTATAVIKAKAASDIVEGIDEKIKAKTLFIRSLTLEAEAMIDQAKTDSIKAECKKVYEAVRYSDPMSCEVLSGMESQITLRFAAFSEAVKAQDETRAESEAKALLILLEERNKKCKLLK